MQIKEQTFGSLQKMFIVFAAVANKFFAFIFIPNSKCDYTKQFKIVRFS